MSEVIIFSNPIPVISGIDYDFTSTLSIAVTVTGSYPTYTYDAKFYDEYNTQIGATYSGINSGTQIVSTADLPTPSGIDYSWYVWAVSSGTEDTSATYVFSNRFLCAGYTEVYGARASGIPVRLYHRSDGSYIDGTTSTGIDGTFQIPTPYTDYHYAVAIHPSDEYMNAEIYDWLAPTVS